MLQIPVKRFRQSALFKYWMKLSLRSYYRDHADTWENVSTYVQFVGHGRSGHSLVAALLNAHPNIAIADELDSLRLIEDGISREWLYTYLLYQAQRFAEKGNVKGKRQGRAYNYTVKGQSQGAITSLKVIGEASLATARLYQNAALLREVQTLVGVPLTFLQVVRSPYDSIARLHRVSGRPVDTLIKHYFSVWERTTAVRQLAGTDRWHVIKLEQLIAKPEQTFLELSRFLALEFSDSYVVAAKQIIFKKPNRARDEITWTPSQIESISAHSERYEQLHDYTFDS